MNHLIVLPGNSPRNQEWAKQCGEYFAPKFGTTQVHFYQHWIRGEAQINFEQELSILRTHVEALPQDTHITIYAKSVGTLLTLMAYQLKIVVPDTCVFFGMPLDLAAEGMCKESWALVSDFAVPAIAFHNRHDPVADCTFVFETLKKYSEYIKPVALEGNTHDYLDFEAYAI
jgi:hypothetical protein